MKKIIIIILLITLIGLFTTKSFSRYESVGNVNINDTTGNIKCSMEIIDTGNDYSANGYAQFRVIIKNSDEDGNISKTPMEYYLVVSNTDTTGKFNYLDALGNSNTDYLETLTTRKYKFNADALEQQQINIEILTESYTSETVNYQVDLYCNQILESE